MAEYFIYTTLFNNTLTGRSDTSFAPLPPNTGEILTSQFVPTNQPLYLWKEDGGSIVPNDQATIDEYLDATQPPQPENPINLGTFTGYTATTHQQIEQLSTEVPLYAFSKTQANGTFDDGFNLSVNRVSIGTYDYTFDIPASTSDYGVFAQPFGTTTDTNSQISNVTINGFRVEMGEGDNGTSPDVLVDTDHSVMVYGVPVSGGTAGIPVVPNTVFTGYTATTDNRISNIETDLDTVSGQTDTNTTNIATVSGQTANKIDKVPSATEGNVATFTNDGQVEDLEIPLSSITGETGELKSVQVRQSTAVNNIPASWADFNFDTTDIENDPTVIEHNTTNTDRIFVFESGLYMIYYHFEVDDEAEARVRVNDSTVINGSNAISDASAIWIPVTRTFLTNLTAGDYVTLQTQGLLANQDVNADATMIVTKWQGLKGEKGDSGGGSSSGNTIILQENNVNVANTPHGTLNFDDNFEVTDNGGGKATVSLGEGVGSSKLLELIDSTGGQQLNNISPIAILWGTNEYIDTNYFTHVAGTSTITVNVTGLYEISYNINSDNQTNSRSTTGIQVRWQGTTLYEKTLTANYSRNASNDDNNNTLPPCTISLNANEFVEIVGFRLGDDNSTLTKAGASFVRMKYLGT